MSSNIIHIENLKKSYSDLNRFVLSGLDLDIDKGEIYGFLGPNGAGKTTTVNIISGLLKADSGKVEIFGKDYIKERDYIKLHIGLVPQNIALYPELTAYENLIIFGSIYGINSLVLKQRISDLLELFSLTEFRNKKVVHFSGGMKRIINLMIGILHKPELLILDEPTVGIDVQSKMTIIETLKSLNNEGVTMLYTSHNMEEAQNLCTKVGFIDGGKLVLEGTPDDIIKNNPECGNLENVYIKITGKSLRNIED